jgi:hypothetical protein
MSGTVHSDIALTDVPGDRKGDGGPGGEPTVDLTVRSVSGNVLVTRGADAFAR